MSVIDIQIGAEKIARAEHFLKALGPKAKTGIVRALNRTIIGMRASMVKETRKEYNVMASAARDSINIAKASNALLLAAATSSGNRIPLIAFGARPSTASRGHLPAVGVSAEIRRGRRQVYPGTFIGSAMRSGKQLVFKRKGKERLPVISIKGPSVPEMMEDESVIESIRDGAVERFEKELDHEIEYAMSQAWMK